MASRSRAYSLRRAGRARRRRTSRSRARGTRTRRATRSRPRARRPARDVSVSVAFTTGQREAAHGWYVESYGRGNCPPGLAKKNNGCLPPGQAKKRYAVGRPLAGDVRWSPLPPTLATRVGPPPAGYLYVSLDGDLLKLAVGTMLVVDAIQGLVN